MKERTILLSVEGMTCGSCARHVTGALRAVEGVRDATVDVHGGSARVEVTEAVDASTLCAAIVAAGYGARVADADNG